jgi:hypothetical protein
MQRQIFGGSIDKRLSRRSKSFDPIQALSLEEHFSGLVGCCVEVVPFSILPRLSQQSSDLEVEQEGMEMRVSGD